MHNWPKPNTKKAVEHMGLGALLNMTIDGVPSKLGFYVVDILNTRNMALELMNCSITITMESIHEILGIPNQGIDLQVEEDVDMGMQLTNKWREQFSKPWIRPMDVMKLI